MVDASASVFLSKSSDSVFEAANVSFMKRTKPEDSGRCACGMRYNIPNRKSKWKEYPKSDWFLSWASSYCHKFLWLKFCLVVESEGLQK